MSNTYENPEANIATKQSHRQLLVHAQVMNRNGHTSDRFVDSQVFDLWQFLLQNRHGFTVVSKQPCLWIPDQERRRQDQFDHSPYQQAVQRLTFECYDQATGITETHTRFVAEEDLDLVTDILLGHLSKDDHFTTLNNAEGEALSSMDSTPVAGYMASSWSMPRGLAPVRSAIRS